MGRILDALEAIGQAENTAVLFSSDHGELLSDHGLMAKHCAYETSMRVPMFATGPGIDGGRISDAHVELIDLATICDLAGCPLTHVYAQPFVPLLTGWTDAHRSECVCIEDTYRGLRTDGWKYIRSINDIDELYDLSADPQELSNVSLEHPRVVAQLRRRLKERLMEGGCNR